jgi:dTDP-4-dehydrorhamnose 3,5-epimerase
LIFDIVLKFIETKLKGCFILEPKIIKDERGYFIESFNEKTFQEGIGQKVTFVQDNQSFSTRGVLRGLHYQCGEHAQAKLVRVLQGEVLDVVVDLRPESKTYGEYHAVLLSAENKKQFFIPKGFAHGFLTLTDNVNFLYKCDNYYSPEHEGGIAFDDPDLKIEWPYPIEKMITSDKDKKYPTLKEYEESNTFIYGIK